MGQINRLTQPATISKTKLSLIESQPKKVVVVVMVVYFCSSVVIVIILSLIKIGLVIASCL